VAKQSKKPPVEDFVLALNQAAEQPASPEFLALIREGLTHRHWMAVEQAARLVARHQLQDFDAELAAVFARFRENGAKTDPGCRAKAAALTTLDGLERFDPEPFLEAIRYAQHEPALGGAVDTAAGVRQRATFALLRQCHSEGLLYAAERLADPELAVRIGVAEALGVYGGPGAAALVIHRLLARDEPDVLLACASSALNLESDFATPLLRAWLHGSDDASREIAALAFGQSKRAEHVELLIEWADELGFERDIELSIRALSMQRSERARKYLLELVSGSSPSKARSAANALAEHRYDAQLARALADAASRSPHPAVRRLVETLLKSAGTGG
jgi:HEAT repeat protein